MVLCERGALTHAIFFVVASADGGIPRNGHKGRLVDAPEYERSVHTACGVVHEIRVVTIDRTPGRTLREDLFQRRALVTGSGRNVRVAHA